MCISPQRHAIFRHLNRQKWSEHAVFCTFWLANVLFTTAACIFSTSVSQKVVPDRQFFNIFTSECAFRHSGVQFCDIRTSKSGPGPSVFWHVYFRMCFSLQRRTILRHQNFQKWSRTLSFLTFLLPNVLFATAACNFWCHLSAPTSAPAALTDLLLDWPDTRIYEKTQHFVTSLTFGADVSSFLLTFWLLHLLSTDLTTPLLLFNSPYCRKFLFKLPSINISSGMNVNICVHIICMYTYVRMHVLYFAHVMNDFACFKQFLSHRHCALCSSRVYSLVKSS